MNPIRSDQYRQRRRQWAVIIGIAVLFHAALFITIEQDFFEVFRHDVSDVPASSGRQAAQPDAIVAITIDIEGDEPVILPVETPQPSQPAPSDPGRSPNPVELNLDDLLGESQSPRKSEGGGGRSQVLPRPIEITWPETRDLGHCRGLRISIRIHVDEEGNIIEVQPGEGDFPADCTRAALEAAQRIRFRPGMVKGKPAAMWISFRIDFSRKN